MAGSVHPAIAPLLRTEEGRFAVNKLIEVAKLAPMVDRALGKSGVEDADVSHQMKEVGARKPKAFIREHGGSKGDLKASSSFGVGFFIAEGAGIRAIHAPTPGTLETITQQTPTQTETIATDNGITVSSSSSVVESTVTHPGNYWAQPVHIVGIAGVVAGAAAAVMAGIMTYKGVKFHQAKHLLGQFIEVSAESRDAMRDAGLERAADDPRIFEQYLDAVSQDVRGAERAVKNAARSQGLDSTGLGIA